MDQTELFIFVKANHEREADNLSNDLVDFLKSIDIGNKSKILRNKEDLNTMDMGAIVQIVLASASVTALAKGLSAWMGRKPEGKLSFTEGKGKKQVDISGLTSKDIVKVMEKLYPENE